MRSVLQCIAAALGSVAIPVAGALWVLSSDPVVSANGSIDDAPERAAMFFLFASPGFLLVLAIFFGGTAGLLQRVSDITLGRLLMVNLGVALAVATAFAHQGYTAFGARDAVISFVSFGVMSFASLTVGSTTWWLLRPNTAHSS